MTCPDFTTLMSGEREPTSAEWAALVLHRRGCDSCRTALAAKIQRSAAMLDPGTRFLLTLAAQATTAKLRDDPEAVAMLREDSL